MSEDHDAFGRPHDAAPPSTTSASELAPAPRRVPQWILWMVAFDVVAAVVIAVVLVAS
jgi:hypothetical protein